MSESVIDISEMRKRYRGGVEALRGVSLAVPKGGIFGLLGPNGAGKSTMVKILLSIVRPSQCRGQMLGHKIGHKPTLARVGYLPEHARFPDYLKGGEVIRYVAGLGGVPKSLTHSRSQELLEMVGMQDWANRRMGSYSKGMKQRIGLAQALVNDPEIVFLDEPTDGVDPKGRMEMRSVLKTMKDQGRTVFINSHLLGELEMICDTVAIMDQGQIVRQGSIADLTEKSRRYEISVRGKIGGELSGSLLQHGVEIEGETLTMYQQDAEKVQPVIDALRAAGVTIVTMTEARQSLEDLFMETVGSHGPGAAMPPKLPRKEKV
ncbi:ABC transporter ATP-binding protein [Verrucomicrobiaceae bacterium R5-34]|uniref:ABC transporter ATP-binding protein n=1 Tax=Oceaniferula flava TaxID=2800421 RepID=A0AAE2V8D7_9BACT|nr:ABC transporter ATP-binding protein [Oceaniferula flavus]MBK1829201.1 ABC transporter ATP-binding protein [Verrucomicrobiaceae bacterium R5-34]MBK1853438.1 ABC transporter ATP-binding protein [Oceaniferula flavus]MBM1134743.1 ABC transporter ATP-binding protein [Oceaniferula flavus]